MSGSTLQRAAHDAKILMLGTASTSLATRRQIGLDYVRAAAIVLVLVCHYLAFSLHVSPRIAYPLGTLGVELFFVLSGFLIGGILIQDIARNDGVVDGAVVCRFWYRRWMRTIPNYLLFLGFAVLSAGWIPPEMAAQYLTFTQTWFGGVAFFGNSWSLAVEEWFYLLLPVLVLAGWMAFGRNTKRAVVSAMILMFVVPTALRLTIGPGRFWDEGIRKATMFRLDAIMLC